jgi:hypothetical protein
MELTAGVILGQGRPRQNRLYEIHSEAGLAARPCLLLNYYSCFVHNKKAPLNLSETLLVILLPE